MGFKKVVVLSTLVFVVAFVAQKYYFSAKVVKSPVIEIANGKLQGSLYRTRDGRDILQYLQIPYAMPPVGKLRYEPPEPFTKSWKGIRDASQAGPHCIQVDSFFKKILGSEDCLFLNVYTPKAEPQMNLPTIVWFHGGLFNFGAGSVYLPDYILDEDVLLVTVNYRLGSFGFLNTGDGVVRGNMGLKDQTMSLKWISENIQKFGGNPADVTIIGESAGGASVHYHMLSPMSKGLFHKAIAQSGMTTNPWAVHPSPDNQVKRFASQASCPIESTKEMVSCLKSKPAMDLVRIHEEVADQLRPISAVFLPTVEKSIGDGKDFITQHPREVLSKGNFNKVPLLAGINSAEGLLMSSQVIANETMRNALKKDWSKNLKNLLLMPETVSEDVFLKIKKHFLSGKEVDIHYPEKQVQGFTDMASEWVWLLGFDEAVKLHLKHVTDDAPIYLYYYNYEGEFSLDALLVALKGRFHPLVEILWDKLYHYLRKAVLGIERPRLVRGPGHGDEIGMEFAVQNLVHVAKDSKDYQFSKEFIRLILQFIRMKPSSKAKELTFLGAKWSPLDSKSDKKDAKYFKIDEKPQMVTEPFKDKLVFWQKLKIVKG